MGWKILIAAFGICLLFGFAAAVHAPAQSSSMKLIIGRESISWTTPIMDGDQRSSAGHNSLESVKSLEDLP